MSTEIATSMMMSSLCCPGSTMVYATLVGLPANLLNCLQSVLNAAARSVAGLRRSDHITDTLASFHWLCAPECIKFKLAVIVYRSIHGTAPRYLSDLLHRVLDITSRRRLQSSTSSELVIPLSRLVTVGDHSFAVAAPGCVTLCLTTLPLRRFYWYFDKKWRRIFTLFCNLFALLCPVVIEVFTEAELKISNVMQ